MEKKNLLYFLNAGDLRTRAGKFAIRHERLQLQADEWKDGQPSANDFRYDRLVWVNTLTGAPFVSAIFFLN